MRTVFHDENDWRTVRRAFVEHVDMLYLFDDGPKSRVRTRVQFRLDNGEVQYKYINAPFNVAGLQRTANFKGDAIGVADIKAHSRGVMLPHPGFPDNPAHDLGSLAIHANAIFEFGMRHIILSSHIRGKTIVNALEVQDGTGYLRIKRPDEHFSAIKMPDETAQWLTCEYGPNLNVGRSEVEADKTYCSMFELGNGACPPNCEFYKSGAGASLAWWVPVSHWVEMIRGELVLQRGRDRGNALSSTNAHYAAWVYEQMEDGGAPAGLLEAVADVGKSMITPERTRKQDGSAVLQEWIDDVVRGEQENMGYSVQGFFDDYE